KRQPLRRRRKPKKRPGAQKWATRLGVNEVRPLEDRTGAVFISIAQTKWPWGKPPLKIFGENENFRTIGAPKKETPRSIKTRMKRKKKLIMRPKLKTIRSFRPKPISTKFRRTRKSLTVFRQTVILPTINWA